MSCCVILSYPCPSSFLRIMYHIHRYTDLNSFVYCSICVADYERNRWSSEFYGEEPEDDINVLLFTARGAIMYCVIYVWPLLSSDGNVIIIYGGISNRFCWILELSSQCTIDDNVQGLHATKILPNQVGHHITDFVMQRLVLVFKFEVLCFQIKLLSHSQLIEKSAKKKKVSHNLSCVPRSEEHTSEPPVTRSSRMPSSAWKKKKQH